MRSSERARELFGQGINCAQAVFVGCTRNRLDQKDMLRLASCFGGGMCHTDQVCGAMTGGLMSIGAQTGMEQIGDDEGEQRAGDAGARFVGMFRERFGSTRCTELIHYDLSDSSQLEAARSSGVFSKTCPKFVEGAAELVELVLGQQSDPSSGARS